MTDSTTAKRVKQAVHDAMAKHRYPSGAIDLTAFEAEAMWTDIKRAISAALPMPSLTSTPLDDICAGDTDGKEGAA